MGGAAGDVAARGSAARDAHEAKCRRCGRCCCHKLRVGELIIYTDIPCPHLDPETRLCRVYETRHEVNPSCLGVEEGIGRGVFPADCPYVAGLPDYRPPIEHPTPEFLAELATQTEAEGVDA